MIVWRWARRALRALLLTLAAVVLLIEEWGWRPLAAWVGRLAAWRLFHGPSMKQRVINAVRRLYR